MKAARDGLQLRLGAPGARRLRRTAVVALQGASVGELRHASDLAATLGRPALVVAVDGGLRTCRSARLHADLFVGDGDSLGHVPQGLPAIVYPADKDFSDFAGALAELRRQRIGSVVVAGLLGGRVDHEWANLFELGAQARHFAGIAAPTARGTVVLTSRGCRATSASGREVSVFALGAGATVTLRGTRWELRKHRLAPGSHGLSNRADGTLDLEVHAGTAIVVFPR